VTDIAPSPSDRSHARWRRPRVGLRTRATIGFGVTALLVSVVLAAVAYTITRGYLLDQREGAAVRQAYVNARLTRNVLRDPNPDVQGLMAGIGGGTASMSLLRYHGEWFATSVTADPDTLPPDLARVVATGHAGRQRYRAPDGTLQLAIGVPIAAAESSYYELFTLNELDRTLDILARSLAVGVVFAALAAAAIGRAAAGRVLRPLAPVTEAAERIASGALDTRLGELDDPDLQRLSHAFNTMAGALEERVEREARFAADVSHELRSPLTAVAAAVEIIDRRRDQLPPQVVEAFTVLEEKVELFQQMVLELLEISRIDAGTAPLLREPIDLADLLSRVLVMHGAAGATVTFVPGAPTEILADRRRLAQVVGNLVDNAARYAGGTTAVLVEAPAAERVRLAFDDAGPGVSPEERDAIFGRFSRGDAGLRAGSGSGTGLGLALAAEHVRLHGGRIWVEDRAEGGARFVIELPLEPA
jgi:signal transduction histidine kinase